MTMSCCVGGRRKSKTFDTIEFENLNPNTRKLVKIIKAKCFICGLNKSQNFTKQMNKKDIFLRSGKSKHGHRWAMSNSAWCDFNKNCTVSKLHDMCHNPKIFVKSKSLLLPNSFNFKAMGPKKQWKNYSKESTNCGLISFSRDWK